jgi:Nuclease-related domain
MSSLIEVPWNRYGHKRVYLKTADGVEVGHVDLIAQSVVSTAPEFDTDLNECLQRWTNNQSAQLPVQPTDPVSSGPEVSAPKISDGADEQDLCVNRAGSAVAAKRAEVNAEAPFKNLVLRLFGVKTAERNWRIGGDAEVRVGRELATLDSRWRVLHAVEVGSRGSDIDHIVIGPGGVITLNTKCRPGAKASVSEHRIFVNGKPTDYLRNSRHEAERAGKRLTAACGMNVSARAGIVFVDLSELDEKQMPDVHVTTPKRLVGWLESLETVLDPASVDSIFAKARRAGTWK